MHMSRLARASAAVLVLVGLTASTAAAEPQAILFSVVFPDGETLETKLAASELGELTGQKLPYDLANWAAAGLAKLGLPYEARETRSTREFSITSIRGIKSGDLDQWSFFVNGTELGSVLRAHTSEGVHSLRVKYQHIVD
jgi:hypothetical protein